MTASERAAQIWPLLVLCAARRETLTYDLLGKLIGVPAQGLGNLLEPIQSYCVLEGLDPLTSLVVNRTTGVPGEGFVGADDVPRAQADVYARDWLQVNPPSAEAFLDASEGMIVRQARQAQMMAASTNRQAQAQSQPQPQPHRKQSRKR
jgi:hypothetical protein